MAYPARLVPDSNAMVLATFPDFPEAATFGADVAEALVQAQDALLAVIAARIDDGDDVPLPSPLGVQRSRKRRFPPWGNGSPLP